jgi:type IV secretory pathway TraG/TraD family ATPase VirD4
LPDRLLDQRATVYLIGDAKASKLLRPIFLALLSEIVDRAYERATHNGGRLERPLLLCLDEAGNVAPLPNLAEIASTAPSHNIQLVSIFHDLAQARSRYGAQAETVVNSHRARMLLPGVADLETLRYFAGLVGEEEALDQTRTTGASGQSRSTARRRRPLVAPEALRQLPEGQALLLYGRLAPTRVKLRMWFADRRLRRLAQGATS